MIAGDTRDILLELFCPIMRCFDRATAIINVYIRRFGSEVGGW